VPSPFPIARFSLLHAARLTLPLAALLVLAGCRDSKPSSSYTLNEPPTSYPAQSGAEGATGGQSPGATGSASSSSTVIWEHLGEWSGNNSIQTESFTGETGALRITWEAKAAAGSPDASFLLVIHSAISGRPLQTAVDLKGSGASVAYVNEDPRVFFAVVDAKDTEWKFSIDEAIGTRVVK